MPSPRSSKNHDTAMATGNPAMAAQTTSVTAPSPRPIRGRIRSAASIATKAPAPYAAATWSTPRRFSSARKRVSCRLWLTCVRER